MRNLFASPVFLSINLADNGYLKQKVVKNDPFSCYLVAKEGWKINTILLNDSDMTAKLDTSGLFTIESLGKDAVLSVSFVQAVRSGNPIEEKSVKVYSEGQTIVVRGAEMGSKVSVYTLSGQKVKSIQVHSDLERIPVADSQVYLIRTLENLYKLAI